MDEIRQDRLQIHKVILKNGLGSIISLVNTKRKGEEKKKGTEPVKATFRLNKTIGHVCQLKSLVRKRCHLIINTNFGFRKNAVLLSFV